MSASMLAFLSDFQRIWLSNLVQDLERYAEFALGVWLILWVLLHRPLRARKIRPDSPSKRQMAVEFLISLRSIAIFSTMSFGITLMDRAGWYPLSKGAGTWGPLWFWVALAAMILGHDAYFYWVHRLMHHPRLFRVFHRRHHRSHNPSPFTAYSFDLGEAATMMAFLMLWPMVFPTPWMVFNLFVLHQIFRNVMQHCGYELMPARRDGRPWLDGLTTTTHHDLHHAQGYNYGLYFTWWDRWMGTEHPDYHRAFAASALRIGAKPRATIEGAPPHQTSP